MAGVPETAGNDKGFAIWAKEGVRTDAMKIAQRFIAGKRIPHGTKSRRDD
jgi:hypothetical protein